MGFVLRLCLLVLISEMCVLANPAIPHNGLGHEPPVPKSTNRQLFMMQDEDPVAPPTEAPAGDATSTTAGTTTKAPSGSNLSTPSLILSVSALVPVFVANKLRYN